MPHPVELVCGALALTNGIKEEQTDRQTDRQRDRQTHRQTDR